MRPTSTSSAPRSSGSRVVHPTRAVASSAKGQRRRRAVQAYGSSAPYGRRSTSELKDAPGVRLSKIDAVG